jgi:hypothetical protein
VVDFDAELIFERRLEGERSRIDEIVIKADGFVAASFVAVAAHWQRSAAIGGQVAGEGHAAWSFDFFLMTCVSAEPARRLSALSSLATAVFNSHNFINGAVQPTDGEYRRLATGLPSIGDLGVAGISARRFNRGQDQAGFSPRSEKVAWYSAPGPPRGSKRPYDISLAVEHLTRADRHRMRYSPPGWKGSMTFLIPIRMAGDENDPVLTLAARRFAQ